MYARIEPLFLLGAVYGAFEEAFLTFPELTVGVTANGPEGETHGATDVLLEFVGAFAEAGEVVGW